MDKRPSGLGITLTISVIHACLVTVKGHFIATLKVHLIDKSPASYLSHFCYANYRGNHLEQIDHQAARAPRKGSEMRWKIF
ncbi:hypothetical protein [Cytobacillus gottheilii]|uniref:hypothetical protein n=1 Tax=Cytobacillus gottheilii TaxID=859144 RepID=UPI0009BB4748|nr:hypothetical protein [Cytobacillus gottheilii]